MRAHTPSGESYRESLRLMGVTAPEPCRLSRHCWSFIREDIPDPPRIPFGTPCNCGKTRYRGRARLLFSREFWRGFAFGLVPFLICLCVWMLIHLLWN